jgi:hypothetical protein
VGVEKDKIFSCDVQVDHGDTRRDGSLGGLVLEWDCGQGA